MTNTPREADLTEKLQRLPGAIEDLTPDLPGLLVTAQLKDSKMNNEMADLNGSVSVLVPPQASTDAKMRLCLSSIIRRTGDSCRELGIPAQKS